MPDQLLTVAISSWNVGASAGASAATAVPGIDRWLLAGASSAADVHVVALQEVIDINYAILVRAEPRGGRERAAVGVDDAAGAFDAIAALAPSAEQLEAEGVLIGSH